MNLSSGVDDAQARLVVVSGLAGAGKTVVVDALEDLGFYCIDNLPGLLLEPFVDNLLASRFRSRRIAVALDSRDPDAPPAFEQLYEKLAAHCRLAIVFLEANDDVILRRFRETRRTHPLNLEGEHPPETLAEAIRLDVEILEPIRRRAMRVIDTSEMSAHYLRSLVRQTFASDADRAGELRVNLLSFGFKHGVPKDVETIFDVRCFSNPYYIEGLKKLTGLDVPVKEYVFSDARVEVFVSKIFDLLTFLHPLYLAEGKNYLGVGIGCTGGKHRSVAIVEKLAAILREAGIAIHTEHRHLDRE
jgi:UPF0042 nucleotide-binding protein